MNERPDFANPLSPVAVENRLRELVTELTNAQRDLSRRRDDETTTEVALKRARLTASHSGECPRPTRGGTTVAERDEWIESRVLDEWEAHKRAVTARDIAQDGLRTTRDIASVVQSLAQSVRQAYGMSGSTR